MELIQRVLNVFEKRFGGHGDRFASAGRINVIGEHTDYNGGFVFPGAIDKTIVAEIRSNELSKARVYSIDCDEYAEFGFEEEDAPSQPWACYIFGVCREVIKKGGVVGGFDAVFAGDIPLGAGLSSSAALESCFAFALNEVFNGGTIDKLQLALIGQAAEHNYCGVNCGIMDQFASVFGRKDYLVRLDCRSLEYKYFPFKADDYCLLLVDTLVKHKLSDSPYNKRRESCERVSASLGIGSLREATMEMLDSVRKSISEEDYRRARFVIGEADRVFDVCDALEAGDFERVGRNMYETHTGLSKDYEVSCEELDYLNAIARESGVSGSRMMGGGFGGCTINLVKKEIADNFKNKVTKNYKERYGFAPRIYDVVISDGARRIE